MSATSDSMNALHQLESHELLGTRATLITS